MSELSDKDTTLTPLDFLSRLGQFDFDPCGIESHKTAGTIIEKPRDGLLEAWAGRVWLNPPYSNPAPWLDKLCQHGNGIALVLASTETKWFQEFILNKDCGVLFLCGRPKFTRLDYSPVAIMRGVVLVGYGAENFESLKTCALKGKYIQLK